jgi:hypothetical protein
MLTKIPPEALNKQYTSAQAAEFLNVTPITLERRRRDGSGPQYLRINPSVVRYRLIDLINYQEQHLVKGVSYG